MRLSRSSFLAAAGAAGVAAAIPLTKHVAMAASQGPGNVLLVHGAWADGSSWSHVIPILQASGHNVVAVQLPHTSHADNVTTARHAIEAFNGPVVVAGHSYGGFVIGDASHNNPKVAGLVYIAAFGLDEGEGLAQLSKLGPPLPSAAHVKPSPYGYLFLDPATFAIDFAADVDISEARVMAAVQKPVHASIIQAIPGPPGWKQHPSWYQISENDRMIPPDAERLFAKRMNAKTISLPSSHASLVSHPREVAALIEEAVRSTSAA
jgi:pimeloyl-ACP methyl ester carboxylesterase